MREYLLFALKRFVLLAAVVFFGISGTFFISHLTPISPVESIIGQILGQSTISPEAVDEMRRSLTEKLSSCAPVFRYSSNSDLLALNPLVLVLATLFAMMSICRSSDICRDKATRSVFSIGQSPLVEPRPVSPKTGRGSCEPLKLSQAARFGIYNARGVPTRKCERLHCLDDFRGLPDPGNNLLLTMLARQKFPS